MRHHMLLKQLQTQAEHLQSIHPIAKHHLQIQEFPHPHFKRTIHILRNPYNTNTKTELTKEITLQKAKQ